MAALCKKRNLALDYSWRMVSVLHAPSSLSLLIPLQLSAKIFGSRYIYGAVLPTHLVGGSHSDLVTTHNETNPRSIPTKDLYPRNSAVQLNLPSPPPPSLFISLQNINENKRTNFSFKMYV